MNILQQLVSDEIARRTPILADAETRLANAQSELRQATTNANILRQQSAALQQWLAANS